MICHFSSCYLTSRGGTRGTRGQLAHDAIIQRPKAVTAALYSWADCGNAPLDYQSGKNGCRCRPNLHARNHLSYDR